MFNPSVTSIIGGSGKQMRLFLFLSVHANCPGPNQVAYDLIFSEILLLCAIYKSDLNTICLLSSPDYFTKSFQRVAVLFTGAIRSGYCL